jgi:methionyl-tRNA formyltransferase
MANYPRILRHPVFSLPPFGTINVHPSMLPAFRGPHPLRWVIALGERTTGVTVHQVDAGIDSGPILAQRAIDVGAGGEAALLRRSATVAADLLREVLLRLPSGEITPVPQDESRASYFDDRARSAAFPASGKKWSRNAP